MAVGVMIHALTTVLVAAGTILSLGAADSCDGGPMRVTGTVTNEYQRDGQYWLIVDQGMAAPRHQTVEVTHKVWLTCQRGEYYPDCKNDRR
jgi:hypothetical protein